MSVALFVGVVVYAAGYLFWWRRLFAEEIGRWRSEPDWGDVFMDATLAGLMALAWLPIAGYRALEGNFNAAVFARKVGGETPAAKQRRLDRERREREAYIAKLERELGIGDEA